MKEVDKVMDTITNICWIAAGCFALFTLAVIIAVL